MVSNIVLKELKKYDDFNVGKKTEKQTGDQNSSMFIYPSLITHDILWRVQEDYEWTDKEDLVLVITQEGERITNHLDTPLSIHTHSPWDLNSRWIKLLLSSMFGTKCAWLKSFPRYGSLFYAFVTWHLRLVSSIWLIRVKRPWYSIGGWLWLEMVQEMLGSAD